MSDLVFLHARHVPRCTAVVDKRFDGYFTLQFMTRGRLALAYDEAWHHLEGRWFWPAFPGPRIRFTCATGTRDWEHRYVACQGPLVSRWFAEGLWPRLPQPEPAGRDLAPLFDELLAQLVRSDRWGQRRAANLLERVLLELAEARGAEAGRRPWLDRVLAALEDPARQPGQAHLASLAGMGLTTFRRRFRAATGLAPHAYAIARRIAEARRLLGDSDLPITEVAARLGYHDVCFFSRQFRRQVGTAPAAFRRSRQGG